MRPRYSFGSHHTGNLKNIKKQRVKYPKVMREVIDISDIVLHILDARFIREMRNEEVEESLKKLNKKSIFVLNKADLVDMNKIKKELPQDLNPFVFVSATTGLGASELRRRIKIEAKRVDIGDKKRVHVGVIGYPNAGKSSIINLLARRGVAKTSKQAGFTRGMQKIKMIEGILILDTPGVIPEKRYTMDKQDERAKDAIFSARTFSDVKDPEYVVHSLMKDYAKNVEEFYGINAKGNSEILIEEVGKKKNLLKKGGRIDEDRAARAILKDWQEGKIKV